VTLYGTEEALGAVEAGFAHPSYVPLERLSAGTVSRLGREVLEAGDSRHLGDWKVETFALHHYSGDRENPQYLDTLGFLVDAGDGAAVAYLSDHEPTPDTRKIEDEMASRSRLLVLDSHFLRVKDQAYGHGSQEHTARLAEGHPDTIVLAGHLNPNLADDEIERTHAELSRSAANYRLAFEGKSYRWNVSRERFELLERAAA